MTSAATARPAATSTTRLLATATGLDPHRFLAQFGAAPDHGIAKSGHAGPLVAEVDHSGLAGRGGGWFPTGRKMHAVVTASRTGRKEPVVVVNAMEGEPAAHKDDVLIARHPHLVIDGAVLAAEAIGARVVTLVGHRGSRAVATLEQAVEQRLAHGTERVEIRVLSAPARYVASEESALAHFVGEGIALPTTVPPRVFESGVRKRPTLLSNAETFAHIALIARRGAAWFRSVGDATVPGTTLVTVGGVVGQPGVVEVPTGTTVRDIIARAGGTTTPIRAAVTGGYGGTWVAAGDLLDQPWTPEGLRAVGGVPGAGVLVVLPETSCGLAETARVVRWMAGQGAGQCGPCRFGLAAVADDLDKLVAGHLGRSGLIALRERLGIIPGRGACRHPDGVARFAASALSVFEEEVQRHALRQCTAGRRSSVLPVPSSSVTLPVARPGEEWR